MSDKRVILRDLFALANAAPLEVINQLQRDGLIADCYTCLKCNKDMNLQPRQEISDKYGWRCRKCGTRKTIRVGSWFSESHLPLAKILQITYCWVVRFRNMDVVRELELSEDTVVDWFNFCREVCVEIVENNNVQIGGAGVTVEIDEFKFGKRKNCRSKHDGQWVFGGVERNTGKCFLKVVKDRTTDRLVDLIRENIKPGTTIVRDCWRASDFLSKLNYEHLSEEHSITFKDAETGVHNIEGTWSCVKKSLPVGNRSKQLFASYLAEFMYRRLRKDSFDAYKQFLKDVATVYNPSQINARG